MNKDLDKIMRNVGVQLMNTIQMGISYSPNWSQEFSYKEVLDLHSHIKSQIPNILEKHLKELTKEELLSLGFKKWDEDMPDLLLIPLWIYDLIPSGTELISIDGSKVVKGQDEIDLDVRFGCIAYGLEVQNETSFN